MTEPSLAANDPKYASGASPLRSVATQSFNQILRGLGVSILVSTYQSGRLVMLRADETSPSLNTHFRAFENPMGIAVGGQSLALGTARSVWELRDQPAVGAKLEPAAGYDSVLMSRRQHITGDIRIHEIGFAGGELWIVNTRFSTLCTVDGSTSFVPRWRPPFVTQLAAEDRCHLNGMTIVDDRVQYVTALGVSNVAGGWREHKASGGILMDVPSGETILRGLSMPHSPRLYDGRFWILESGKGTLSTADLKMGRVETVLELPGFTRGLAFAGQFAFVGLSQVRESNVFGGIPLVERIRERQCGVWVVDLRSGTVAAFLRFEEQVQEIFDVQVLQGTRWPDLLEPDDALVLTSYSLPDSALADMAR